MKSINTVILLWGITGFLLPQPSAISISAGASHPGIAFVLILSLVIMSVIVSILVRSYNYRKKLRNYIESYNDAHQQYEMIYQHMPVGFANPDTIHMHSDSNTKERINDIFHFAMNASSLGIAEYNLLDGNGFATNAWYKNLCIGKQDNFAGIYCNVIGEDHHKLAAFLNAAREGREKYFHDTIRVKDGERIRWMIYVAQVMDYMPGESRVIIAALTMNIDKQKRREQELAAAINSISQSHHAKNACIAGISNNIRPSLEILIRSAKELITEEDPGKRKEIMLRIEEHNSILLLHLGHIATIAGANHQTTIQS